MQVEYSPVPALEPCESLIEKRDEVLLRIVKTANLDRQNGTPTAGVFVCSSTDENKLSVFQEHKTNAQQVLLKVVASEVPAVEAIWGIEVQGVHAFGLAAVSDCQCGDDPFNLGSHAYLDFRNIQLNKAKLDKVARLELRLLLLEQMISLGRLAP